MNKALSLDEQSEVLEKFTEDAFTFDQVISNLNKAGYHIVQYIGEDENGRLSDGK